MLDKLMMLEVFITGVVIEFATYTLEADILMVDMLGMVANCAFTLLVYIVPAGASEPVM
jgi:hypothetical protein